MTPAIKFAVIRNCYKYVAKPYFFMFDPEFIHDRITALGHRLGRYSTLRKITELAFSYQNEKKLSQKIWGLHFRNPVGLGAGYDKDGYLLNIMPSVGFGFMEIGSITARPCPGNPKPRLWRLKKSRSLVVNYGLKSLGAAALREKLRVATCTIPLSTNIALTNTPDSLSLDHSIEDYAFSFQQLADVGQIFVINISCPNTYCGQPFHEAAKLDQLLKRLDKIETKKPVLIKISPDLTKQTIDSIVATALKHRVHGVICTNLTKNRTNPQITETELPPNGGLSGLPVRDLSTDIIRYIYKQTQGKLVIIGLGGIFSAEDAYEKIKAGASLVQLVTGLIFNGPQTIGEINFGLTELMKRDGFKNISQAVGKDVALTKSIKTS